MKNLKYLTLFVSISFVLFCTMPTRVLLAETFVGSNNDSRIVVALRVKEEPVQAMLPDGWTSTPFPGGALTGANALVVLIDRYLAMDAEGNPSDPYTSRGVALASLAKNNSSEEVRLFVTRIFAAATEYDPYGNAVAADIRRRAMIESSGKQAPVRTENWVIAQGGGEMTFSLTYEGGTPSWSAGEAMPYSSTNPEFNRIYRFDQLADLAMSGPLGISRTSELSLVSTIPELTGMFDGSEEIVAVIVIPMYVRKVYLP